MIKLVSIVGESYDLETGNELPKSIVLTNGIRQLSIPVSDEVIKDILMMEMELKKETKKFGPANHIVLKPTIAPVEDPDPPTLAEPADAPGDEDPGFEYADSSTGTMSI